LEAAEVLAIGGGWARWFFYGGDGGRMIMMVARVYALVPCWKQNP